MSCYISIDLDYFTSLSWSGSTIFNTKKNYRSFFKKLFSLCVPTLLVESHEHILEHVNSYPSDILYNMDYHNDVFPYEKDKDDYITKFEQQLTCGNWGNHVDWRSDAEFVWCLPDKYECWEKGYGDCNECMGRYSDISLFPSTYRDKQKFHKKVIQDFIWGKYRISSQLPVLKDVHAVGICLSIDYIEHYDLAFLADIFTNALDNNKIQFGKDMSQKIFDMYFSLEKYETHKEELVANY